jgi:hypothetical protein
MMKNCSFFLMRLRRPSLTALLFMSLLLRLLLNSSTVCSMVWRFSSTVTEQLLEVSSDLIYFYLTLLRLPHSYLVSNSYYLFSSLLYSLPIPFKTPFFCLIFTSFFSPLFSFLFSLSVRLHVYQRHRRRGHPFHRQALRLPGNDDDEIMILLCTCAAFIMHSDAFMLDFISTYNALTLHLCCVTSHCLALCSLSFNTVFFILFP